MASRDDEAVTLLAEALKAAGAPFERPESPGVNADLVLTLGAHRVPVQIKRWAIFPEHAVRTNPAFRAAADQDGFRVVVADRIGQEARRALQDAGWGWLDRRGTLHLEGSGVFIHADVPPSVGRPGPREPLRTPAGLAVACGLLAQPIVDLGVRALAHELGRSPSTVSEILKALRDEGLVVGTSNRPSTELFWAVADAWPSARENLAGGPAPGAGTVNASLSIGFDDVQHTTGWALTGALAAAAYGAPIVTQADQAPDYYVPTAVVLRRARTLLGTATPAGARATVRVAPVPAACSHRVNLSAETWPLAAPLFVALDLAQDAGRGREILADWTPPEPWTRVW
jgi:hypothetical protein